MRARRVGLLSTFIAVAGLTLAMTSGDPAVQAATPVAAATADRPNVVLISADDMRADDLELMPRTQQLLGKAGITFTDAVSNYPLCCPARATILTGQYSHNNGVQGNEWPHGGHKKFYESGAELETLPVWLRRAGYNTAFVGKYLNYYGSTNPTQRSTGPTYVPPGWNDWHATVGRVFRYYCPTVNHNGSVSTHRGEYQTDLFTDLSTDLIDTYARKKKPFFLWTSHLAPHVGTTGQPGAPCAPSTIFATPAAQRHQRMFTGMPLPKSPALNEADMSDKGTYMQDRPLMDLRARATMHQNRLAALQSLDESVATTIGALARRGILDETLIVFVSDNGWLLGEHRSHGKILPYEESLRVPLLVRGPGLPRGARRHQPAGVVDITATILEATKAVPRIPQDGVSLAALARDPAMLARRVMPIEAGPAGIQRKHNATSPKWYYRGVRSSQYSYIGWQFDKDRVEEEVYDLDTDPFQLDGRADGKSEPALVALRAAQAALQDCAGDILGAPGSCVQELLPGVEDGKARPQPAGDTVAPTVKITRAPRGWVRATRATVRYTATDSTDPKGSLAHWCSHQAGDCTGTATLKLRTEGPQTWSVLVTDRAGNVGHRHGRFSVDLYAPRIRSAAPRSSVANGSWARLGWRVLDTGSGVRSVDTRIRTISLDGKTTRWTYPRHWQRRARPLRGVALPRNNATVCLEVRARDKVGRQTRWMQTQCRSRAVDAAGLTDAPAGAWKSPRRAGWLGGTGTVTRTRGASLTLRSVGPVAQVRIVGRIGANMGRVRVEVGGRPVGIVNLGRRGRTLKEFVLPVAGRGRVTVRVTSAGKPVWLDSVGVVRRPGR